MQFLSIFNCLLQLHCVVKNEKILQKENTNEPRLDILRKLDAYDFFYNLKFGAQLKS